MPADFTIKAGQTNPAFTDTLQLGNGFPPPLEGATLTAQLRSLRSASIVSLTGTATIVDIATGAVQYVPSAEDTAVAGNYMFSWLVTFDGATEPMSFPTQGYLWWKIEPSLTSAPQLIVDLPSVKEHLGINPVDHGRDSRLIELIQVVTPLIEAYTGPILPQLYEEWHDGGTNLIRLDRPPAAGFGTSPQITLLAASEYRGPIEYPLSIVASPVFGSIYSVFLNQELGTLTRRTAGGATIAFMPGRESIHVLYEAGQAYTPHNVAYVAKEAVRVAYEWSQQTGEGSRAVGDVMDSPSLSSQLTPLIRSFLSPTRRAPSFA